MRNLVMLLLLVLSTNAMANSCFLPPLEERYRETRHILLVEVIAARIKSPESYSPVAPERDADGKEVITVTDKPIMRVPRKIVATIRVLESYKGSDPPTEVTVSSWGNGADVTVGAKYLVFMDEPEFSMDCDGMQMISGSDPEQERLLDDLRALRK